MAHRQSLADDIMAALLRANEETDYVAAEHLLRALEAISQRDETEERVNEAYIQLAHTLGFKRDS